MLTPLPKKHVCYVSPDGQSRQCFALETLRQIALKAARLQFRVDLDGGEKVTFLQPPHFRTAMSDDLLDQIASRFGRQALVDGLKGETISHILVTHTHSDHSPAAGPLAAATGAPTYGFGPHGSGRPDADIRVEEDDLEDVFVQLIRDQVL